MTTAEPVTLKSDNEAAIRVLRRRVDEHWPGASLEQSPAAHEHESSGVVESGV